MANTSRREFLVGAGTLLLAGCAGGSARATVTCPSAELDEYGAQTRATVHYVDAAPSGAGRCKDCRFWLGTEPDACGSCHLVRGPIHPQGSCNIFLPREASTPI